MNTHRSKITRPVRERMESAGYDDWVIKQAAKQRLAMELVEPDPDTVPDADDSSLSRDAVLT